MAASESKAGAFEKVGECLYRYSTNGVYYARSESRGKEIRRSLGTTDKATARRRLGDLQRDLARVDLAAGRCSLAEMCDRYLKTVQNQRPKTVKRKTAIARRVKADLPNGADVALGKIVPSKISAWLASYDFGSASYNLYLEFIRAVFNLAVEDRLVPESPVARLKAKRPSKPIRQTPSFEDFRAIVEDIRAQRYNADFKDSGDFVEFIGLAGLGQAEAASLRWSDIDWKKERITTFRHKTSRGFVISIYPQLWPLLERLRQERGGGGNPPGEEAVLRIKDAKHAISKACAPRAAGVQPSLVPADVHHTGYRARRGCESHRRVARPPRRRQVDPGHIHKRRTQISNRAGVQRAADRPCATNRPT